MDEAQDDVEAPDSTAHENARADRSGEAVRETAQEILTLLEATLVSGDAAAWQYVQHAWETLSAFSDPAPTGPATTPMPMPAAVEAPLDLPASPQPAAGPTAPTPSPWAPTAGSSTPSASVDIAPETVGSVGSASVATPSPVGAVSEPARVSSPVPPPAAVVGAGGSTTGQGQHRPSSPGVAPPDLVASTPVVTPPSVVEAPSAQSTEQTSLTETADIPPDGKRARASTVQDIDPRVLADATVLPFVVATPAPPASALDGSQHDAYGETLSDADAQRMSVTLPFKKVKPLVEPQPVSPEVVAAGSDEAALEAAEGHVAQPRSPTPPGSLALPSHLAAMTVEQYAALCAECAVRSEWADRIAQRYNIRDRSEREAVDRYFRARMQADPELLRAWQAAYEHYERWARQEP